MAANIPMVSSIVAGLMSQEDKIKLDALPASITGSDPLSSSVQRAHQLSASYFSMSSGSVNIFSASRITVTDLVVINTNMTGGGATDPFSASVIRAHNLSASYFEFISGNVRTLTGTGIKTVWLSATSGTYDVVTSSYQLSTWLTGTTGSFSIFSASSGSFSQILSASTGTIFLTSGSYAWYRSASIDTLSSSLSGKYYNLSASYFEFISGNVRTLTGTGISGSSGTYHVLTESYVTSTISQIFMLSGSRAWFVTASIDNASASAAVKAFNLSASYFEFISGNVRTLTGTGISGSSGTFHVLTGAYVSTTLVSGTGISGSSGTFHVLTAAYINTRLLTGTGISGSSGTFHVLTGAYFTSTISQIFNLSGSHAHIVTASIPNLSASAAVKAFNLSASYFEFISGNVRTLTGTGISGSSGTFHVLTAAYISNTLFTGTGISGSSGTFHVLTGAYMSATRLTVTDLVVINTNMTGGVTDPLSSSIVRAHQLSASYFSMSSGSINILTSTYFSASSAQFQDLTCSNISITSQSFVQSILTYSFGGGDASWSFYNFASEASGKAQIITQLGQSGTVSIISQSSYYTLSESFSEVYWTFNTTYANGGAVGSVYCQYENISSPGTWLTFGEIAEGDFPTEGLATLNISSLIGSTIRIRWFYIQGNSSAVTPFMTISDVYIFGIKNPFGILSGSVSKMHEFSASYFSMSSGSINILSASEIDTHNLSASYYQFISGNVRTLTGTGLQTTWFSASSGTFHVFTGTYVNTLLLTGTGISGSSGTFHIFAGTYVNTLLLTGTGISGSSGTFHIFTGTYVNTLLLTGTGISGSSGTFHVFTGTYVNTSLLTGTGISGSSGTFHVFTGAYVTSSILQTFNISASYVGIVTSSHRSIMLTGVTSISPVVCYVSNANFSQAASTQQAIPFMSHSIAAGEVWKVECQLLTVMTGTGGVRFAVAAPSGAIVDGYIYGTGSSATTSKPVRISASNTEMGQVFTNVTLTAMPVMFYFTVRNANTAGVIEIWSKRATATNTLFISTGSSYEATKARIGENNTL